MKSHLGVALFGAMLGCILTLQSVSPQSRRLADGAEELHEEEQIGYDLLYSDQEAAVVTCVVLLLILLTILFEFGKAHLEEHASHSLKHLIEKLFGELTVLGFLSVMTFAITKFGWFSALSELFFGEEEELLEIFEFVHFTIFFIMIFFVCQVVFLVKDAIQTEQEWIEMDKVARQPGLAKEWGPKMVTYREEMNSYKQRRMSGLRDFLSFLPFCRRDRREEDQLLFNALRDEFLLERCPDPPFDPSPQEQRLSKSFNFGRYLAINQGSLLAHVVEVKAVSWVLFGVLVVIYYLFVLVVNMNLFVISWSWVGVGWLVFLFNVYFEQHLNNVRKMFLRNDFLETGGPGGTNVLDTYETSYRMFSDGSLPIWSTINIEEFVQNRSWLTRWLVHGAPNRQHAVYMMDRRGPQLYLLIMQWDLIFVGVYTALLVLGFFEYMYQEETMWVAIVYTLFALVPLFGMILYKRHIVAILSQVSSIGAYRRPNIVTVVLREEKTEIAVRAFVVIFKIRDFASRIADHHQHTYNKSEAKQSRVQFDSVELDKVAKTFEAFDTDGNGAIQFSELEGLMKSLGADLSSDTLTHMINLLDENGDGEVSQDEFINWYAHFASQQDELTEHERAHHLFSIFDHDESGEITMEEFKRKLDALNVGFTVDEVGAIVNELDQDNNGTIGLHEFQGLLHKYYPRELLRGQAASRENNYWF